MFSPARESELDLLDFLSGTPTGQFVDSIIAITSGVFEDSLRFASTEDATESGGPNEQPAPTVLAQLVDKEGLTPTQIWAKENPGKQPSKRDLELLTEEGKAVGRFTEKEKQPAKKQEQQESTYKGGSDANKKNPDDVLVNGTWITQAQYQQLKRRREQMKQEIILREAGRVRR